MEDALSQKIVQMSIDENDLDTLKLCLESWPREQYMKMALKSVGNKTFAEICPPLNEGVESVVIACIDAMTVDDSFDLVDKIIENVRMHHSQRLDVALRKMIERLNVFISNDD